MTVRGDCKREIVLIVLPSRYGEKSFRRILGKEV
jgi:hypothetical protein